MATKRTKTGRAGVRVKRRYSSAKKVTRTRSSDAGDITPKPMLIGYARVSTVDQNLALQRDALTEAGCQKIFTEQMSGAVTDRPALHDALEFARSGDTLIVWKLLYSGNPQLLHRHLFSFRLPMSGTRAA
jgi:predicted site-specific integrase-resolvase